MGFISSLEAVIGLSVTFFISSDVNSGIFKSITSFFPSLSGEKVI